VLRHQHRQDQNSPITTAANTVHNGLMPELLAWTGQDEGIHPGEPAKTGSERLAVFPFAATFARKS